MPEPQTIVMTVLLKKYGLVFLAGCSGALAHALESVKTAGWKGWLSFVTDIIVCTFFGAVFFQAFSIIDPNYAIFATSLGSYWGTASFKYLKEWLLKSLEANIKLHE